VGRQIAHTVAGAWLVAFALGLPACGPGTGPEKAGAASIADLAGAEWTLVGLDGAPLPAGTDAPTARFEAGAVAGFGGCNRYRGAVRETSPGALEIGPLAGTRMACAPPAMDLEGRFLAALAEATRYALADGRLSLDGGGSAPAPRLVFDRR
jgi:heat shock protein HslJ